MDASLLLLGATGAVGSTVLRQALASDVYERVVTLTRRPLEGFADHPKLESHVLDFDRLDDARDRMRARDVVNAMGTTHKKAGSKERFAQIDHDYPLAIARHARDHGARRVICVSSVGANARSWSHYLRVKGRLEDDLQALGYDSVVILRPSLLLGERDESRPGEAIGKALNNTFSFLMPRRYRGIHVDTIAERILQIGRDEPTGVRVLESEEIPVTTA